jgi:hypothetical protein
MPQRGLECADAAPELLEHWAGRTSQRQARRAGAHEARALERKMRAHGDPTFSSRHWACPHTLPASSKSVSAQHASRSHSSNSPIGALADASASSPSASTTPTRHSRAWASALLASVIAEDDPLLAPTCMRSPWRSGQSTEWERGRECMRLTSGTLGPTEAANGIGRANAISTEPNAP